MIRIATIRTAIELYDNFSSPLLGVVQAVNQGVSVMENFQSIISEPVSMSIADSVVEQVNQAAQALEEAQTALNETVVNHENSKVNWINPTTEVFQDTGADRFQQEVQSANAMLEQLSQTQRNIAAQAERVQLFPAGMVNDMNTMQNRIQRIQERIQTIVNNPLNLGTDQANAELEYLRNNLNQAVQTQNDMNAAIQNMDITTANDAYIRLSNTVAETEKHIRDNVDEQGRFNREIESGTNEANQLMQTIKGAVATYATTQTLSKALNLSDQLTSTTARLNLMNDGLQTTQDLQSMIYLSAERARGSYQATADAVSKLGLMADGAFGSSEEIISFMEQVNKQFTIAGTEAAGIDAAMLQLTQAMDSGVLRGEEYNSILEQAPNIIQAIADYMEVSKGQLKDMAAEGQITADIVKAAMFAAADDTNAKFEQMPKTFSQIWTSFQNTALMSFQPVLQRMNEIANSEAFQGVVNNAVEALSMVAGVALEIFDLLVDVAGAVADNWSWLSPIIYGVASALAVYYGWLLLTKGVEMASAAASMIHSLAMSAKIGITAALTGSTMAATAAQMGYNGALYACPIVWIIILIIALIAIIFAVCNAIAKMTGVANSGFGVIVGCIYVVGAAFQNLWLLIKNIALGIQNAIEVLCSNMMAAFHNSIYSVQSWFYNLLSTALSVVERICEALNKLPFVEFDYTGISSAADNFAAKSAEAAGNKENYASVSDAWDSGFSTFDTFQDGWASEAFDAGAAWGDGIAEKFSNAFGQTNTPTVTDYADLSNYGAGLDGIGGGVDDIAGNTGKIADSMDITEEDLKYLRDIAEQESINRFTTAEITIEQTNHNTVSGKMDLDGVVDGLTDAVNEAVDIIAEGVHK